MSETKTGKFKWKLHGDGKHITTGEVVQPNERLTLSLIHISEPTRLHKVSRMPSSA